MQDTLVVLYDEDFYTEHIEEQQERLFYSKFLNDNFNYRRHFYLNKGNFCDVLCFSMNIVAFLSVKLELFSKYKGDYDNWSSNNFERPPQENGLLDVSEPSAALTTPAIPINSAPKIAFAIFLRF